MSHKMTNNINNLSTGGASFSLCSVCKPKRYKCYQLYYYSPESNKRLQISTKQKDETLANHWANNFLIEKNAELKARLIQERQENFKNSKIATCFRTVKIGSHTVSIDIPLIEAYRDFFNFKFPLSSRTRNRSYQDYKALLKDITNYNLEWSDITPKRLLKFLDSLRIRCKETTIANKCVLFIVFFRHCVSSQYIPESLFAKIKALLPKKGKSSHIKSKYIPESVVYEILNTLKETDHDMYLYVKTLYYTVSRPQEIASLQYFHINGKFNYIEIPMMKVHHSKTIEDAKELIDELRSYASSSRQYVFKSQDIRYYSNKWNKLMFDLHLRHRRSNGRMENNFDIRHLRHTAITNITNIHGVEVAQRFAGHSKVETTKGYYQSNIYLTQSKHINLSE
ncbi:MAG: tyrosine-type recombinase/integrase [Brevinema sp.]